MIRRNAGVSFKRSATRFMIVIETAVAWGSAWCDPATGPSEDPKFTVVNVSSHCDWCWGHTRMWHEQRYAEIIRQVLVLMRDNPNYVWLLENENEELAPFLEKAGREWPGMVEEFWRRVREGRIEVIGAVCNPRFTEVYPETIVRNLVLAKEDYRRNAPRATLNVYNAVDLMCGPSQMPQILAKAGYRYFMFSRPMGPQVVFWRKGLDGTRMLSARCFYGYNQMGKFGEPVKGCLPSPIWRLAIGADDQLPDPKLPREAAAWDQSRKVLGTNSRYFEEVEKCGAPITELKGSLDSLECYVEAGVHGDRSLYMQNNQDEDLLLCLEKAQVMALAAGEPIGTGAADQLWRDVLACAGHAIQWAWTVDYEERLAFARFRRARIEQALHEVLSGIVGKIKFRGDLGAPLVVFNFHAWPVSGPVEFAAEGDPSGLVLRDGAGGAIPMQWVAGTGAGEQGLAFIAEGVPACGYRTFYLSRGSAVAGGGADTGVGAGLVETDGYRVRIRADGALEVFDKASGLSLGVTGEGLGDIAYRDAPPSKSWEMNGPLGVSHAWATGDDRLRRVQGPVFASARASGTFGAHSATRELRIWRGSRRLDYRVELNAADGSGVFMIRFPVGISGRVRAGIPFGAEPRENLAEEPFRGEIFVKGYPTGYCATRWTDISSDAFGYTFVCPPGAHTGYGFEPDEKTLEFILLRVRPLTPDKWGQMHPSIKGTGHHVLRCAVVPHAGAGTDAARQREAMESHVPLMAFSPDLGLRRARVSKAPQNKEATLDDVTSFAEVGPSNVILSALRVIGSADGNRPPEIEIRLYEGSGQESEAHFRLHQPFESVRETDFLGNATGESGTIDCAGREMRFKIAPWKIVNLRARVRE